jgi:hypothetical protein
MPSASAETTDGVSESGASNTTPDNSPPQAIANIAAVQNGGTLTPASLLRFGEELPGEGSSARFGPSLVISVQNRASSNLRFGNTSFPLTCFVASPQRTSIWRRVANRPGFINRGETASRAQRCR